MQKNLIIISILTSLLGFSGCAPHRIDIQQGNKVTPENFAKLKPGMNQKQVTFVLGTPLLKDPFHQDRWDYVYYKKPGNQAKKQSRVTLYFDGDTLIKIDDSAYTPDVHHKRMDVGDVIIDDTGGGGGGGGHSH